MSHNVKGFHFSNLSSSWCAGCPAGCQLIDIRARILSFLQLPSNHLLVTGDTRKPFKLGQTEWEDHHTHTSCEIMYQKATLIVRFMGPAWGPSGADRTQVGPMLAPWTLLSEKIPSITMVLTCLYWSESHDDVIKWKYFSSYWPFVWGIHWSPVNSPHKGPVMLNFDVFFDLCLNKQLSKQSWGWWFETPSHPLLHHCNDKGAN